jgi:hypothetical protein
VGGKALALNQDSPYLVQEQQARCLISDVEKKKHGIASLLNQIPDLGERKTAVHRVLTAEWRAIQIRARVDEQVERLTTAYRTDPKEDKKAELRHWSRLQEELRSILRQALWATTVFSEPEACYEHLLYNFYIDSYAHLTDLKKRPSFQEFCSSADSLPFRRWAAETASTLIVDPIFYRLFCQKHHIEPRDYHINRFLNTINKDPQKVDLETLGIPFTATEKTAVTDLVNRAIEFPPPFDNLKEGPAEDTLRAAMKQWGSQLQNEYDDIDPSFLPRTRRAIRHFFTKTPY